MPVVPEKTGLVRSYHWVKSGLFHVLCRSFSGPLLEDVLKERGRPLCSYRTFMEVHHETAISQCQTMFPVLILQVPQCRKFTSLVCAPKMKN